MFTFGRAREKKAEAGYVRDPDQVPLLTAVIDAVHDLVEGKGSEQQVSEAISVAFSFGGAGVWECAGKWLRRAGGEYPAIVTLWDELARHPEAKVRFRVAAFLDEVPAAVFTALSPVLLEDVSQKVRSMAEARVQERQDDGAA